MSFSNSQIDSKVEGRKMYQFMTELFPICRSITGNGARQTLNEIKKIIPIKIFEVKSGTKVLDWFVPKEWNIKDAWVKDPNGKKIIDFQKNNLHVTNYSIPVNQKMSLDELIPHLHSDEKHPNWIPYTTSYYKEYWGFSLTEKTKKKLKKGIYEVMIDSTLKDGSLTYAELFIKGQTKKEVLLTTYFCHPSMCNDNLSGTVLLTFLAKQLLRQKLKCSYRLLFLPETIGAITWLSKNSKKLSNIKHGLVATCLGDPGNSTYKKSRVGNADIDKAVEKVLIDSGKPYKIVDFYPAGSDERQFCSPGFNLPVGSLMRSPYATYPEYHTSADNLDFVQGKYLQDTLEKYLQTIFILENDEVYINLNPYGEPQLGRRGLYQMLGGQNDRKLDQLAMLWVLNLTDGTNSLLNIAIRSKTKFEMIKNAADALLSKNLLKLKSWA